MKCETVCAVSLSRVYCGAGCFVVLLFAVGNGVARRFVWGSENRVSAMQRTLWYMIVFGHDSLIEKANT